MEGLEPEPDHESAGDCNRCPEACGSLNECTETKSNDQDLQPAIGSDSSDRLLHDLELPGLDRNIVQVHRSENDPCYFQHTECSAVSKTEEGQRGRHFEEEDRHRY